MTRARAACVRASFFANYIYQGVRNILQRALDFQPLPVATSLSSPANDVAPRFARPSASWTLHIREVNRHAHPFNWTAKSFDKNLAKIDAAIAAAA